MKKTAPFRREKRAAGAGAVVVALAGVATLISGGADAGQIDSVTFFPLQTGMSESEMLIRAGSPDLVTTPGGERVEALFGEIGAETSGRTAFDVSGTISVSNTTLWHYLPDRSKHDPQLTIITMKGAGFPISSATRSASGRDCRSLRQLPPILRPATVRSCGGVCNAH